MTATPLMSVRDLKIEVTARRPYLPLVHGVSFDVAAGELLGIVGESGCGKSLTALSLLNLLPRPHVRATGGSVTYGGRDLLRLPQRELRRIRGSEIAMIFQDPMSSLNPVRTIGAQLAEAILLHEQVGRDAARARARDLLEEVNIPAAADRLSDYPHQLSGGMRQRVMIAMAVACRPRLLIADEPTTALDVTIQAEILALLDQLRAEREMAVVLITHDLGVVAEHADRVLVMYSGRVVETAEVEALFDDPRHPYTRGLLRSVPDVSAATDALYAIEGAPPAPGRLPPGCHFNPRCGDRMPRCLEAVPPLYGEGHRTACFLHEPAREAADAG